MAQPLLVYNMNCTPGIHRDWTSNSSTGWTDGQYCRFMEGRPKKIGGWELIGSLGLTNNSTPFSATGEYVVSESSQLKVGTIRALKTFPINGKFLVVVCADIENVLPGTTRQIDLEILVPSGVFIGISDTLFTMPITFYPVRFQKYFVQDADGANIVTGFDPGRYNWSVSIYGVTSGGEDSTFTTLNPTGGGGNLSSLALVVHAAFTVEDKNSPLNNYVFFGKLSDMLNFSDHRNYALDPNLVGFPEPSTPEDKLTSIQYLYSPVMFPMTSQPVDGLNPVDPDNVFTFPTPIDDRAIYCTSNVIVSGGVSSVGPFLFAYGNNGLVRNCSPNNPSLWWNIGNKFYNYNPGLANDNNVDNFKMLAAAAVRGGAGLSALAWTTNSLWLLQFTGDPKSVFSYINISNSVSLISANSIIEANGIYYWVGEDRFYMYSGAIQPLVNQYNFVWFYDNLNYLNRTKLFAFKSPHYNEIWWVFPKGDSSECNHAIVYNYVEGHWYDTPWERTSGYYEQSYVRPICAGEDVITPINRIIQIPAGASIPWYSVAPESTTTKAIWQHEYKDNIIINDKIYPYNSYITSCDIGLLNGGPAAGKGTYQGISNWLYVDRIEPDLFGEGMQYIKISDREFPKSKLREIFSVSYTIDENGIKIDNNYVTNNAYNYISVDKQSRMMYITFGCSSLNSNFYLGKPVIMARTGDQQ